MQACKHSPCIYTYALWHLSIPSAGMHKRFRDHSSPSQSVNSTEVRFLLQIGLLLLLTNAYAPMHLCVISTSTVYPRALCFYQGIVFRDCCYFVFFVFIFVFTYLYYFFFFAKKVFC